MANALPLAAANIAPPASGNAIDTSPSPASKGKADGKAKAVKGKANASVAPPVGPVAIGKPAANEEADAKARAAKGEADAAAGIPVGSIEIGTPPTLPAMYI
ncbi:hypothetical protein K504DRAFT_539401 [Pleomassaria siparia CBS 279.74]|uniref:Uncharacterized protein n=1 Tax=Pleomassaria siparia CBS 279.74 TaxID=1314801 RepID=A0A6G1JQS3_9PLEO|nr:hypothetical protein K504DRAFT_539401 [Pleomassaria siparia CBS 279.74]